MSGAVTRRALLGALLAASATAGSASVYKTRALGIRATNAASPALPGSPEIVPTANPLIGMNLAPVYNYNPARPFTNLLRYRTPQTPSGTITKADVDNTTGEFDCKFDDAYTFIHPPTVPNARVVVRWTGTGNFTVGLNSANNIVAGTEPGGIKTLAFDTIVGTDTFLSMSRGKYKSGVDGLYDCREPDRPLSQKWEADFVLSVGQWSILRFMDWQQTNDTSNIAFTATNRPLPVHPFDVNGWGISIEDCIDLARVANNSAWINIPYNFDQSYIDLVVLLGHANLRNGQQLFIEYCNEDWNSQFQQYYKLNDAWLASGGQNFGQPGNTYAQQAVNHIQMGTWVASKASALGASLGVNARICRVLGVQTGGGSNLDFLLQRPNLLPKVDAVSFAPYFAPNYTQLTDDQLTDVQFLWERATLDPSSGIDGAVATAAAVKAQVAVYGLPIIGYEGSSHFVTSLNNLPISRQYHNSPFYKKLYAYYLREVRYGIPGFRLCLFNDQGEITVFGPWGTQASLADSSTRIQALRDAAAGIYIVPDIYISSYVTPATAAQGDSYSFKPVALWGDGPRLPRTWTSVGGPIPPGLSLTSATGETSGKGTTQGTYPIRLRVTDSKGYFERDFTITVGAPESYTYVDDARAVGNLPATGGGSSRTPARGWSKDYGYASNGVVQYDQYANQGANLFGAGINSKNRKLLWDFDSTTWSAQYDNARLDLVADEGSGKSLSLSYDANSGLISIGRNGSFLYNVASIVRGPHVVIPSVVDGRIYLTVDGNVFGSAAGYDVGQDYAATQRIGYTPGVDPGKPVYSRIGLKPL